MAEGGSPNKKARIETERDRFVGLFPNLAKDILEELSTPAYRANGVFSNERP